MKYPKYYIALVLILFSALCREVFATSYLPDTNQYTCYNNSVTISCPQPEQAFYGQDAQHQGQQPSYTKLDSNGNILSETASEWDMVKDNITGLIWEVKTDDSTVHDKDNVYQWCDTNLGDPGYCTGEHTRNFLIALNGSSFGGYNDWRIPSIYELTTIINSATRDPAINTDFFPNTISTSSVNSRYWSSTTSVKDTDRAWYVEFEDEGEVYSLTRSSSFSVRAVRGEEIDRAEQLIDNQDGTISDKQTELMWQKDISAEANGLTGSSNIDWEEALYYVAGLNSNAYAGYSDWRLPNRNELQFLLDYAYDGPALNPIFPVHTYFLDYWSSTTEYGVNNKAFTFDPSNGGSGTWLKTYNAYVRAVRDEPIITFDLNASISGTGGGTITSNPVGINCGSDCQENYISDTTITLTATPATGSVFNGWLADDCSGTGTCILTMTSDKFVEASFIVEEVVGDVVAPGINILLIMKRSDPTP